MDVISGYHSHTMCSDCPFELVGRHSSIICKPDDMHSGEVGLAPSLGLRAEEVGPAHGPALTGVSIKI